MLFLFGCEHPTNYRISAFKSVVSCLEKDELPSAISTLMLLMFSASCLCQVPASPASCPLPSWKLKQIQAKNQEGKLVNFLSPTHPSFPLNISSSDTFCLLGLGNFDPYFNTFEIKSVPNKRVFISFHPS